MKEMLLTNIISKRYIEKVNKYVVEIGIKDKQKKSIWLTEKQMINLQNCFDQTPKGYSDKNISIIGVWNEKNYFAFSRIERHEKCRVFNTPVEQNVEDLWEGN